MSDIDIHSPFIHVYLIQINTKFPILLAVEPLILEYFENNDATEVLYTLQEMLMNFGSRRWMVVSILIELAMDHKPSHREMASVLISELYLKVISQRDIGKGKLFEKLAISC